MKVDVRTTQDPSSLTSQFGFEDEILDRPLSLDGWTFCCCMSISEDDQPKAAEVPNPSSGISAWEDEILDRPLSADGFTVCCCLSGGGLTPEGELMERIPMADARIAAHTPAIGNDRMVEGMLVAGASLLDDKTRPTLAS